MRRSLTVAVAALAAACMSRSEGTQDTAGTTAGTTSAAAGGGGMRSERLGETSGLKVPESVRYDADQDVFFVSQIDGNPSQRDGNGVIAKVRADSVTVVTPFIEGGKNGVTLNAPKGMAIQGDTLWVTDIDAVRGFNRRTGAPVASIDLRSQKATFLNDVAVGGDGAIYVTDTGIGFDDKGQMSHPGVNRIFRIAGRTVTEAAKGDSLASPNGITWDASNNRFLVASFEGKDILAWTPGSATPTKLASGPGQFDGIEIAGGMVFVSSWADSSIHMLHGGEQTTTKFITGVNSPADIGVDTKRRVIAVPLFSEGKVVYYSVN